MGYAFTLTRDELEEKLNTAKEIVLEELLKDGILTEEQVTKLSSEIVVVVRRKGIFGMIFDKVFGSPDKDCSLFEVLRKKP